jgi:hypothetical protein
MTQTSTTIASLAAEFNAQPHEVAAFADLGDTDQSAPLDEDTEAMIREAWAKAPVAGSIDASAENRNTDAVLDALADVVDSAGYDD